jgi:hypothetical protein
MRTLLLGLLLLAGTAFAETYIPADLDTTTTPIVLNIANETYILTEDFTAPGTAFEITNDGITLDLGGNTVWFDLDQTGGSPAGAGTLSECDPALGTSNGGFRGDDAGIFVSAFSDSVTIRNGTLNQYPGGGGYIAGISFRSDNYKPTVDGVTINMTGWHNTMGIMTNYGYTNFDFRNNTITLSDTCSTRRETLWASIKTDNTKTFSDVGDGYIYNNTIRNGGQSGIELWGPGAGPSWAIFHTDTIYVRQNDIAIRANTTNGNAFHMTYVGNAVIDSNTVDNVTGGANGKSGGGIIVEAGANAGGEDPGNSYVIRHNDIAVKQWRSPEYVGTSVFAHGIKTEYASHAHFYNNNVKAVGFSNDADKYTGFGAGFGILANADTEDVLVYNNTIEADNWGGATSSWSHNSDWASCISLVRCDADWEDNNIRIFNNHFKSNDLFLSTRNTYSQAVNPGIPWILEDCVFELTGDVPSSKDSDEDGIQDVVFYTGTASIYGEIPGSKIINPSYAGGPDYPDLSTGRGYISSSGSVGHDYGVYYTLEIQVNNEDGPVNGATISATDALGTLIQATTDANGYVELTLPAWKYIHLQGDAFAEGTITDYGSYTIEASHGGESIETTFDADAYAYTQLMLNGSNPVDPELVISTADITDGVVYMTWQSDGSALFDLQLTISGVRLYNAQTDSTAFRAPVHGTAMDIKIISADGDTTQTAITNRSTHDGPDIQEQ